MDLSTRTRQVAVVRGAPAPTGGGSTGGSNASVGALSIAYDDLLDDGSRLYARVSRSRTSTTTRQPTRQKTHAASGSNPAACAFPSGCPSGASPEQASIVHNSARDAFPTGICGAHMFRTYLILVRYSWATTALKMTATGAIDPGTRVLKRALSSQTIHLHAAEEHAASDCGSLNKTGVTDEGCSNR
ncbi:hypothetical protein LMG28727_02541 [Paraburkholderia kirstenboschensis]|nr:hypothetical protein LMG28727_02541 [Paraburkholderia kirstenboschensis]